MFNLTHIIVFYTWFPPISNLFSFEQRYVNFDKLVPIMVSLKYPGCKCAFVKSVSSISQYQTSLYLLEY